MQTIQTVHASGSIEFHGGVSQWSVNDSLSVALHVPSSCAPAGCDALGTAVQASASQDVDSASVTCTAEGSACACQLSTSDSDETTRSYTVSGTNVSFEGISRALGYCVSGEQLLLRGPTETFVLRKAAP
jgi:hypothetical protein